MPSPWIKRLDRENSPRAIADKTPRYIVDAPAPAPVDLRVSTVYGRSYSIADLQRASRREQGLDER